MTNKNDKIYASLLCQFKANIKILQNVTETENVK